jgi:hypothetical protein
VSAVASAVDGTTILVVAKPFDLTALMETLPAHLRRPNDGQAGLPDVAGAAPRPLWQAALARAGGPGIERAAPAG